MSTPEENAPKTHDTDQVLPQPDEQARRPRPKEETEMGAKLKEAMKDADLNREDLTGSD
ncbi:hypothetical protein [Actinocorallia populi]|uniref:hypothetical protein n=1 Tax=Actinocorallia populi TaxID=2079200 RepID=UPI0018E5025B|nr:hypothetical protein [Actinocorallia populi]